MTITTTTDNKYLKIILWIDKYVNIDNIFMSKYIQLIMIRYMNR